MTFSRPKSTLLASGTILLLALTGCAGIGDTASSAASSAASQLAEGAKKEMIKTVCSPIKDGTINAGDLKILNSMVDAVREGGLPREIVKALDDVAAAGDKVPADTQARLVAACDSATQ